MRTERDFGHDDEQDWEVEDEDVEDAEPDEPGGSERLLPDPLEHPF